MQVHNVVKHLQDTRRRLDAPPSGMPYYVSSAVLRYRFDRDLSTVEQFVYHEVVARETWGTINHAVDTGRDLTESAQLRLRNPEAIEIETVVGAATYQSRVEMLEGTPHSQGYNVHINPPLPPGGKVGYRRVFVFDNSFPLDAESLQARASEARFPDLYHQGSTLFYSQAFDVTREMESLTVSFTFPSTVTIRSARAVAIVTNSGKISSIESDRISAGEFQRFEVDPESGETHVELRVRQPLA